MAGGLKRRHVIVAQLATVGNFDLVVADEAIRHGGHVCGTYLPGDIKGAMAGLAGIAGFERLSQAGVRHGQVTFRVEGGPQDRSDVAELQMQLVVEFCNTGDRGRRNDTVIVTLQAYLPPWEQIIASAGAGESGRVAAGTVEFEPEVKLVGKRRCGPGGLARCQQRQG